MPIDVAGFIHAGPEQFRRIVGLRLADGSEITSECAIAMIKHHGARFRHWVGDRWRDIRVIPRKVIIDDLDC